MLPSEQETNLTATAPLSPPSTRWQRRPLCPSWVASGCFRASAVLPANLNGSSTVDRPKPRRAAHDPEWTSLEANWQPQSGTRRAGQPKAKPTVATGRYRWLMRFGAVHLQPGLRIGKRPRDPRHATLAANGPLARRYLMELPKNSSSSSTLACIPSIQFVASPQPGKSSIISPTASV